MHRQILGVSVGGEIDHINRDRLDNRRGNLRKVTRRENCANRGLSRNNTSGHPGIWGQCGKWKASVPWSAVFESLEDAIAWREEIFALKREWEGRR
jgi:hypothetical protein